MLETSEVWSLRISLLTMTIYSGEIQILIRTE